MTLTVIPLKARYQKSEFDLFNEITKTLSENGVLPENGDVIVISSKYIASSQGRISVSYTHLTLPTILLV